MLKVVKNKKQKRKKQIIIFTAVCVIFMLGIYYLPKIFKNLTLKTEFAKMGTISETISVDAVIVRDEITFENATGNFLKFIIKDGEKIKKHGIIAKGYKSKESAVSIEKIKKIDEEINFFKECSTRKGDFSEGFSWINNQINEEIKKIKLEMRENNFSPQKKAEKNIQRYIGEKLSYLGNTEIFSEKIKNLENEKNKLKEEKFSSVLTSPEAGYFSSFTDGLEQKFDYKTLAKKGPENLDFSFDITENNSDKTGKIIKSDTWFFIFEISNSQVENLKLGGNVYVNIPNVSEKLPCEIKNIEKNEEKETSTVALACGWMNKTLAKIRKEKIKIELSTYSGLKIDKNAIIQKNKNGEEIFGVYVKVYEYIMFKKVKPTYFGNEYIICESNDEEKSKNWLQIGDKVVINSKNVYDGMKI